jgi:hypothetical protein
MKFEKVYQFEVEKELRKGKEIWFVDKQKKEIGCVNGVLIKEFFEMINPDNENRFHFWIEEQKDV